MSINVSTAAYIVCIYSGSKKYWHTHFFTNIFIYWNDIL